ncbi:hypothetical protein T03_283 [Trichinella britovi]|uniref:Uncharacterized protein n=1 Tax=Trichinella britovi TaxID=45882 RepID=A0A0V1C9E3_TRIBR|nr:hypothetical protein T03_283 [Trichinella britovi]
MYKLFQRFTVSLLPGDEFISGEDHVLQFNINFVQFRYRIVISFAVLHVFKKTQDFQQVDSRIHGQLNKILELKKPELPFLFGVWGSGIDSKFVQGESLIHDNELSNKL